MLISLIKKTSPFRVEAYLGSLMILFFVFRQSNPLFKYPFIILYLWFVLKSFWVKRSSLLKTGKEFLKDYLLAVILLLIIVLSWIFSSKIYLLIFKDTASSLIVLSFFFILTLIIPSVKELTLFFKIFIKLLILFALLISFLGFLDLFGILPYESYFLIEKTTDSPFPYDNNFGLLPVLLGISGLIFYIFFRNPKVLATTMNGLLASIFSLFVLLSGSKRGVVIIFLIILSVLLALIVSLFRKNLISNRMRLGLGTFIFTIAVFSSGFYMFFTQASFASKNDFLKKVGTKDLVNTKEKLSNNIYKFYSLFEYDRSLKGFHEKLWSIKFDSKDPDAGWGGTETHKTVFPLSGENVIIVPGDAKGILIDASSRCDTWDGDAYSITQLGRIDVKDTQKVVTSVYCYVSDDFNGNWAELILLYTKSGEIHGTYDLQRKGNWQKLSISDECLNATAESRFCFSKQGVTNFSSLHGYLIIASPQFSIIDPDGTNRSLYSVVMNTNKTIPNKYILSGFGVTGVSIHSRLNNVNDTETDPIRNLMKKFIVEDTTYYGYNSKIELKHFTGPFKDDDRIAHWQFATQIFLKEYNLKQKIFGRGFNHLNWFGSYFFKNKTLSDWPHNPFLSVLLYSGLFGLLIYCFFLYKTFDYYLKYFREYSLLFIFFLISFFFSFFSGGSPFDPPIMGFFIILPFFIHTVHKKK
jgi:hypothetical protein